MIELRRSRERGHANLGWLNSNHTFSFGNYYDPAHMGFRVLRVINEDKVIAKKGFGAHPHNNMEIISYVVSGELEHKDSMGNGSVIKPGEFQAITAGSGILHSEFNPSDSESTHFYQIWIEPSSRDLTPGYMQKSFAEAKGLTLVVSGTGENESLQIKQDVKLYLGRLAPGENVSLPIIRERYGWIQIVRGDAYFDEHELSSSDGLSFADKSEPEVKAITETEFLFFDLP